MPAVSAFARVVEVDRDYGASGFRVGRAERIWVEIEAAEVEVDGVVESLPISVTACHALDPLDLRVHSLAPCVGDVCCRRIEYAVPVVLDQPRNTLDGLQARADRPVVPSLPCSLGPATAYITPEHHGGLLDRPGSSHAQLTIAKRRKPSPSL